MEIVEIQAGGLSSEECQEAIRSQFWRFDEDRVIRINLTGRDKIKDYPEVDFQKFRAEMPPILECPVRQVGPKWVMRYKLPEILDHLGDSVARLKEGQVETYELVISRRLTRTLEEYRVNTPSVIAFEQSESVGLTIRPGQKVGYLLRDSAILSGEERILLAPFLEGGEDYDKKKYFEMLLKAAAELLVTFGLDFKNLFRVFK